MREHQYRDSRIFPSKLIRLLNKRHGNPEPVPETLNVLVYEIGDLHKALTYKRFYPEFGIAYNGEGKAAMADAIAQMELLAEELGWDWEELREIGDERFLNSDELDRRHAKRDQEQKCHRTFSPDADDCVNCTKKTCGMPWSKES